MYKAVILPLAKQDIRESARWYNKQQKGLGKRFTKKVREKVQFIVQNSDAVATRYKDIKTSIVDVFPYMIHYKIDHTNKQVVVMGVFSMAQNPVNWYKRE